MMLAPGFPTWLPPVVAEEAERIVYSYTADNDLVLRLATDKRMESVWNELKKHKVAARPQLESCASHEVAPRAPPDGLTDQEAALTLFFWFAYAFAFMRLKVGTFSSRDVSINNCKLEAAVLRLSAIKLLKLDVSPIRETLLADISTQDFWDHYDNIEKAAQFHDEIAGRLIKLKTAEAPLVVSKDYGNRDARGYVRILATETRKLFGTTLIRTLATTTSVALSKEITPVQVRKWVESLPK